MNLKTMKFRFCGSLIKIYNMANPELTFHINAANLQKPLSSSDLLLAQLAVWTKEHNENQFQ